jgi:hypothetical protein
LYDADGAKAKPGWLDPEAEWSFFETAPERREWGRFGIDF